MTALFKKLGVSFFLEFAIVHQHDINLRKFDVSALTSCNSCLMKNGNSYINILFIVTWMQCFES